MDAGVGPGVGTTLRMVLVIRQDNANTPSSFFPSDNDDDNRGGNGRGSELPDPSWRQDTPNSHHRSARRRGGAKGSTGVKITGKKKAERNENPGQEDNHGGGGRWVTILISSSISISG